MAQKRARRERRTVVARPKPGKAHRPNTRRTNAARARSRAASKGWETRRANARRALRVQRAEHKRRSDAAKRGWEKRRKKQKDGDGGGPPIKPKTAEFAVSADYKARKRGSSVSIQIAMRAPENATKADLANAVTHAINHDGEAPDGYEIAIVDWKGNEYFGGPFANAGPADNPKAPWSALSGPLALADVKVSPIRKG